MEVEGTLARNIEWMLCSKRKIQFRRAGTGEWGNRDSVRGVVEVITDNSYVGM